MPRKKNAEEVPKALPKRTPKGKPKAVPEIVPVPEPKAPPNPRTKRTPRPAPIAAPIVAPENYAISFYPLPNWENDHSTSPRSYGNQGRALYQAHTEGDGKAWLRDNEYYGHFAAVERINGKIGKSWHVEIEEPEEIEAGDDLAGDDWALIDPDTDLDDADLLNPAIVRAKIENAKLRAQLEARNGSHGSIGELLQGLRALDDLRGQGTPQKSLAAQIREAKELLETFIPPRREPNPAQASPTVNPEAAVFQLLARDDGFVEKIADGLIGKLVRGESSKDEATLADVAMEAVKSGQAAAMVNSLMSGLQGIVAMIMPQKAQGQADPRGQVAPATQPAPAGGQQSTQALPTNNQPAPKSPTAPATQPAPGDPYTAMLTDVITSLMDNAPVDGVIKRIDGFLIQYPTYREIIDNEFSADAGALLMAIGAIPGCAQIPQLPHAKQWIEQFQAAFFAEEEGEEAGETAPDGEESQ